QQTVNAYGKPVGLLPGMTLQADILLDRRRLIDWVLEPLYGFGRRFMGAPAPTAAHA
ncbi:colicin V secretion protein, partial [mine drainage metagenome]